MAFSSIIPSENSEGGSLLLDIPLSLVRIPNWLSATREALGYKAKDEYHVTIIGLERASLIQKYGKTSHVGSLIKNFVWTIKIEDQYIELAKDDENGIHRQSIICTVTIPELVQFYKELDAIVGVTFELPPTHLTVFTKNYDRGIGVYDQNDLLQYKVRDLVQI